MKVLFLIHPGTNSKDIFGDMVAGFRGAGHEVIEWKLDLHSAVIGGNDSRTARELCSMMLRDVIVANGVELCVGMWANGLVCVNHSMEGGKALPFYAGTGCRHLMFWLDAPHWTPQAGEAGIFGHDLARHESVVSLINNPATAEEMRGVLGMGRVIDAPYGINTEVFRPHDDAEQVFDIAVSVGAGDPSPTPTMLVELERDEPDVQRIRHDVAERLLPEMKALGARFTRSGAAQADRLLGRLLQSQVSDRHLSALERVHGVRDTQCAGAADEILGDPRLYIDVTSAVRKVEQWERAFTAAHLSRRFECVVMGAGELDGWGVRGEMLGYVPYAEMARVYCSAKIGVNVMRWQDDAGSNIKPFEITASGTAALCGKRIGLNNLWEEGGEIAVFDSPGEAVERARELIEDGALREGVARAGYERTVREHTWDARADQIIELVSALD